MSTSKLQTVSQLDAVLSEVYDRQPAKFVFDLVILLLQGKNVAAAKAAVSAKITANRADRRLELVFDEVADFLSVRSQVDLLASMADAEDLSEIVLWLKSGKGRTPISPKMLELHSQQRRKPMMSSPIIALPGIHIGDAILSPALVDVINEFNEHPDWACGVVELKSQRQIMITGASARMILGGDFDRLMAAGAENIIRERVAAATRLKRENYFYLPHLEEFMRMTRQDLEPNNASSRRELTWWGQARDGSWVEYTHEYRTVMDAWGHVYHVGRNLGFRSIPEPVAAIA